MVLGPSGDPLFRLPQYYQEFYITDGEWERLDLPLLPSNAYCHFIWEGIHAAHKLWIQEKGEATGRLVRRTTMTREERYAARDAAQRAKKESAAALVAQKAMAVLKEKGGTVGESSDEYGSDDQELTS